MINNKKNILILSATNNSNLKLSNSIKSLIKTNINVNAKIIKLEDYSLPLFKASNYEINKKKNSETIKKITNLLIESDGIVICSPEYNGSIPPIVTNIIAWISVTTKNWRDAFINKVGIIASSSGGPAIKYNVAMKNQLEHLGMIILPKSINIYSDKSYSEDSTKKILEQLINLI